MFYVANYRNRCYNIFGDGTHNKKQRKSAKGMTPIAKNIRVVDNLGKEYEATYLKRAKGLVKNGRARFIDENTICLVCPPEIELEDIDMSENKKVESTKNTSNNSGTSKEVVDAMANLLNSTVEQQHSEKLTMDYILSKLEEISLGQAFFTDAISELAKIKSGGPGDVGTQEQAKAIGEIIKARETTNQKLIALYEKMYDDLKPKEESAKSKALEIISKIVTEMSFYDTEQGAEILSNMLDTIRHLN